MFRPMQYVIALSRMSICAPVFELQLLEIIILIGYL